MFSSKDEALDAGLSPSALARMRRNGDFSFSGWLPVLPPIVPLPVQLLLLMCDMGSDEMLAVDSRCEKASFTFEI